jgi:hypothetical protein
MKRSGQDQNPERLREDRAMQNTITLIVVTNFLCWVPFIVICAMHNLGRIDATKWYVTFAMFALPLNSVINPLIYCKSLKDSLKTLNEIVHAFRKSINIPLIGISDSHQVELSGSHQSEIRIEAVRQPENTVAK